jgi:hypothetical protein
MQQRSSNIYSFSYHSFLNVSIYINAQNAKRLHGIWLNNVICPIFFSFYYKIAHFAPVSYSFLFKLSQHKMRRPFPRIPGSPQATPIAETPAQYALALFWSLALLFEVVNGNVRA